MFIQKILSKNFGSFAECKIMRDLTKGSTSGKSGNEAPSKGYAFVTFTEHQSALNALRKLNNNPEVIHPSIFCILEVDLACIFASPCFLKSAGFQKRSKANCRVFYRKSKSSSCQTKTAGKVNREEPPGGKSQGQKRSKRIVLDACSRETQHQGKH